MAVNKGDKVTVEYEGKLENGQVFDSTERAGKPLEFVAGSKQVIESFDEAVKGMEKGQEKEISIEPEKAYGEYNPQLKKSIPRDKLPQDQEPKEGMALMVGTPDGNQIPAKIVGVDNETITIDLNHPLAGKKLNFKIKLVDSEPSKE